MHDGSISHAKSCSQGKSRFLRLTVCSEYRNVLSLDNPLFLEPVATATASNSSTVSFLDEVNKSRIVKHHFPFFSTRATSLLNSMRSLISFPYSFRYCSICFRKGKYGVPSGKSLSANVIASRGVFAHKFVYIGEMNFGGIPLRGGSIVKASTLGTQGGSLVSVVYSLL